MKPYFYKSFILPFSSKTRLTLFVAQMLGAIAIGFLSVFVTLDMVQFNASGLTIYTVARFAIAGFIGFPILTALYLFVPRFLFSSAVVGAQCLSIIPLLIHSLQQMPLGIGCCMGVASAAYWQVYHLALTAHASDQGRGYEVSLSQILMTVGGAAGAVLGGWAAACGLGIGIAAYAFALQILASLIFCCLVPSAQKRGVHAQEGQVSVPHIWHEVRNHPQRTILTIVEAFYTLLGEILRPAWLKIMGVAALAVGVVSALIIIIQAVVAPLAGKFYAENKMAELRWGSALLSMAWLPWIVMAQTTFLFFSVPFWAAGTMMVQTGLSSRWYRDRSVTAVLTRELLMTVVRVAGAIWIIPLMFTTPTLFAALVMLAALLLLGVTFYPRKKLFRCRISLAESDSA